MKQDKDYTLLLMSLPISTCTFQAESVIGSINHGLVTVGDSVQFYTEENEVLSFFCGVHTICSKF